MGTIISLQAETWEGWKKVVFKVDGREAFLIEPQQAAAGQPWIWRTEFFGHAPSSRQGAMGSGFHVAYIDMQNLYGGPRAMEAMDAMYARVTSEYKLSNQNCVGTSAAVAGLCFR